MSFSCIYPSHPNTLNPPNVLQREPRAFPTNAARFRYGANQRAQRCLSGSHLGLVVRIGDKVKPRDAVEEKMLIQVAYGCMVCFICCRS